MSAIRGGGAEALEGRVLLSADFARGSSTGTLLVFGDAAANTINIIRDDSGTVHVQRDAQSLTFDAVKRISVDAGDGDDHVTIFAKRNATLLGGNGNDTLTGGAGNDSLDGG